MGRGLYQEKRFCRKELEILKILLYKGKMRTTDLSKELYTYNQTISTALAYLRKEGLVNTEKHGRNVFNVLTQRGKIISKMLNTILQKINPESLLLDDIILSECFPYELREWLNDGRKTLKNMYKSSKPYGYTEPLLCSVYVESCYDKLIFSPFLEEGIPLEISQVYNSSSSAFQQLADGKIDMGLLPFSKILDVLNDDPNFLRDLTPLLIFAPFGYLIHPSPSTCVMVNLNSPKSAIYYPEGSSYRKKVAENESKRLKTSISTTDSNMDLIKGFVEGDYKYIVTHFPYDVLLSLDHRTIRREAHMDPGILTVNKNTIEKKSRTINKFLSVQFDAKARSLRKSWQYKHVLKFIIHEMPYKLETLEKYIPSMRLLLSSAP